MTETPKQKELRFRERLEALEREFWGEPVPAPVGHASTRADERARSLVGYMPWVTEKLTAQQVTDLVKQIAACIGAAEEEIFRLLLLGFLSERTP